MPQCRVGRCGEINAGFAFAPSHTHTGTPRSTLLYTSTAISSKVKRLDKQNAAGIVGNGDNGIVGLFESAQKRFIGGQVILLVVGPFGEVNKDIEKVESFENSCSFESWQPLVKTGCQFLHCTTLIEREELLL